MAIHDIYSKRLYREQQSEPDVFIYDEVPPRLRGQIVHLIHDALGDEAQYTTSHAVRRGYETVHNRLCREYGIGTLSHMGGSTIYLSNIEYVVYNGEDIERVLDIVEVLFTYAAKEYPRNVANPQIMPPLLSELNQRFIENCCGYQFENWKVIRIENKITHAEIIKPTLFFLSDPKYSGPNEEFMKAHEHLRAGNYKESINESLKALESTLKSICTTKKWAFDPKDTAKKLIDTCLKNGLIDSFWQCHFNSLQSMLKSGVPTARNKVGGHGQGQEPTEVPQHLAAFCINSAAAAILFLVQAAEA